MVHHVNETVPVKLCIESDNFIILKKTDVAVLVTMPVKLTLRLT
jgi:hypothetical protein